MNTDRLFALNRELIAATTEAHRDRIRVAMFWECEGIRNEQNIPVGRFYQGTGKVQRLTEKQKAAKKIANARRKR